MKTTIVCNKDLFNVGKCFTKDSEYTVNGNILTEAGLIDKTTTNDLGEPHRIGSWWRYFTIKDTSV